MRFQPMAAVRAAAMATRIASTCAAVMPWPRAAMAVAARAKGRAKTVWLNFTIRPKVATTESTEVLEGAEDPGIARATHSACCAAVG